MSQQTIVNICNLALLSVASRSQISSLNDGSAEADACATLFNFVYTQLARTARWNCLQKQATLSMLAAAQGTPENPTGTSTPLPPTPWLYTYAYPSDCLAMRYIVPSYPSTTVVGSGSPTTFSNQAPTWLPTSGSQIPFQVAYSTDTTGNPIQVIYTNQDIAQAVYTVNQPNPSVWDSLFTSAMVASLAAYLVPAINLNMALMQQSAAAAERLIMQARVADGNEGVTVVDHVPDWIRVRGYIANQWGINQFNQCGAFADMQWPGQ